MSHEITIREDGFAEAAFALKPAWHGLGRVYDQPMTSREALEGAGLDWTVQQEPVYRLAGPDRYEELTGHVLNTRSDNDAVLGMVSEKYQVVQNTEAFEFLDALVEDHQMLYESAFSLRGGKSVVLLARMPGVRTIVEGDQVLDYVLLSLGHDGTEGIQFGPTSVRVVCANTYAMAQDRGTLRQLSIRHTGSIRDKLEQARSILSLASEQFGRYAEIGTKLAEHRLSHSEWREYLDLMVPPLDPRDPDWTKRRAKALGITREAIEAAYHNDRQATAPNSAWAAYNAVAEHIDHRPRKGSTPERKAEARFNVTLSGVGMSMKQRAFAAACRFAGVENAG